MESCKRHSQCIGHLLDQQLLILREYAVIIKDYLLGIVVALQDTGNQESRHQKAGCRPVCKALVD